MGSTIHVYTSKRVMYTDKEEEICEGGSHSGRLLAESGSLSGRSLASYVQSLFKFTLLLSDMLP